MVGAVGRRHRWVTTDMAPLGSRQWGVRPVPLGEAPRPRGLSPCSDPRPAERLSKPRSFPGVTAPRVTVRAAGTRTTSGVPGGFSCLTRRYRRMMCAWQSGGVNQEPMATRPLTRPPSGCIARKTTAGCNPPNPWAGVPPSRCAAPAWPRSSKPAAPRTPTSGRYPGMCRAGEARIVAHSHPARPASTHSASGLPPGGVRRSTRAEPRNLRDLRVRPVSDPYPGHSRRHPDAPA